MKKTYRATILSCYNGYITQAISINFAPLLYLTFQRSFGLSISDISFLIAANFLSQLAVDVFATVCGDKLNLRLFTVLSHLLTVVGLFGLSLFPMRMPPFWGLMTAEILLGIGGGFTEVMISPLLEACPTEGKSGNMSLLHSFYCWGQMGVILLSSLYFSIFEITENWIWLPCLWAIPPFLGAIAFCIVPIYRLPDESENGGFAGGIFRLPAFWKFLVLMLCSGAAEMTMSQWASGFAESALGVPKEIGDLSGACLFALMMGISRAFYGKCYRHIPLERMMFCGGILCTFSYLFAALVPIPVLSFVGCALCGLAVGIFWPGILSTASEAIPTGGMTMFASLALAGDIGCLFGPSVAGMVADAFGGNLRAAFAFAAFFPLLAVLILLFSRRGKRAS